MIHINDRSFVYDTESKHQLEEPIKSRILSGIQEIFLKSQSKCLEYLLLDDSKSVANETQFLLQINPFNENWLRNETLKANSSCKSCCQTNATSEYQSIGLENDLIQANGIPEEWLHMRMKHFDEELNMIKLQLPQIGSTELMSSKIDTLGMQQHEILLKMQLYEESLSLFDSTMKLNEIFFNDLTVNMNDEFRELNEKVEFLQGRVESHLSMKLNNEGNRATQSRLDSERNFVPQLMQNYGNPVQNAEFNVYIYCLEFAKRIKKKRLDEYFNSDKNMIYFIFITCVENNVAHAT